VLVVGGWGGGGGVGVGGGVGKVREDGGKKGKTVNMTGYVFPTHSHQGLVS